MSMIDLYVEEVGEHLPAKMRADIQTEIRSLIEDTLEGRSQAAGREPDDAMIVEVLKEFGSPEKMAASYLPPRYLIGPRLFPTFLLVIRIVVTVLGILALIGFGVAVGTAGPNVQSIVQLAAEHFGKLFISLLSALGNIVFIFAILEWALPKGAEKKEGWDPRSLKPRPEPERINPVSLFWGIGMAVVAILVFNLYQNLFGIWYLEDGTWKMVPFLTEAFFRYVPLMTAVWGLQIVLNIFLLRQGCWQPATRWMQLAIKVFGLVILGLLISGPSIIQFPFNLPGFSVGGLNSLEDLTQIAFRIALMIAIIADGAEVIKMLVRLLVHSERPVVAG